MSGSTLPVSEFRPEAPSTDIDMISSLSPVEREAALSKLFGQLALIEALLAEGIRLFCPNRN
jgi:hypothetical protein